MAKFETFSAVLVLALCGGAAHAQATVGGGADGRTVSFFFGTVTYTSPDGKRTFGSTTSLVKRIVDPRMARIDEIVVQPGRNVGDKASEYITHLTRLGTTAKFAAVDEQKSFSGTLSFQGRDWSWDRWSYDITLGDGQKIRGEGQLSDAGLVTHKSILDKNGQQKTAVVEELKPISEQRYVELRAAQLGR